MNVKLNTTTFDRVEEGQIFKFAEEYYLKISYNVIEDGLDAINAASIYTGETVHMQDFYQVEIFPNATLTL